MLEADWLESSFAEKGVGGLLVDTKLNVSRQRGLAAKAAKDVLRPIEREAGVIYAAVQLCSPIKWLAIPRGCRAPQTTLGQLWGRCLFF